MQQFYARSLTMAQSANRTLCLMPTFRCTAQCEHCGTLSHPRAGGGALSLDQMRSAIEQAATGGYGIVVFTGGEPTLAGGDLLAAMRHASLSNMVVRLVSNAWWAADADSAGREIGRFVDAGLAQVTLSTGDRHARFVPLERVLLAARAAVGRAVETIISVETVLDRAISRQAIESHAQFVEIKAQFPHASLSIAEYVWSPLSPGHIERYDLGQAVNRDNLDQCGGCDSVLNITTIQPDGRICACCGLGMRLIPELNPGNLGEMTLGQADRLAGDDPFKQRLAKEGPHRLLAQAAEIDPSIEWENLYAHRCQACIRIYKDPKVRQALGLSKPVT
jgi:hypothetical protein